jgi:hypothetical protein
VRAAGETDGLGLDEGDPGFQFLTEEEIAAVIPFIYFYLIYFTFILFKFFLSFRAIFCFINPDSFSP